MTGIPRMLSGIVGSKAVFLGSGERAWLHEELYYEE